MGFMNAFLYGYSQIGIPKIKDEGFCCLQWVPIERLKVIRGRQNEQNKNKGKEKLSKQSEEEEEDMMEEEEEEDEEEVYEVEEICGSKGSPGDKQYLVKWKGYQEPTWVSEENILTKQTIQKFYREYQQGLWHTPGVKGTKQVKKKAVTTRRRVENNDDDKLPMVGVPTRRL